MSAFRSAALLAYKTVPFKKELFSLIRSVWRPRKYKSLRFDGDFSVAVNKEVSFRMMSEVDRYGVETEFFWRGFGDAWESESLSLWVRLCEGAGTILDVGACEGVYALAAKAVNPEARVLAFEPLPEAFAQLKKNLAFNPGVVEAYQLALSDSAGVLDFYYEGPDGGMGGTMSARNGAHLPARTQVQTARFDDFSKEHGLGHVDLIKIDVEHHEAEVLRGMAETIERSRPSMIIELLTPETAQAVEDIVTSLGYLYFDINDDGRLGRSKGIMQSDHLRKSSCLNFLLVQPEVAERLQLTSLCKLTFR
jgi:FkbM family methyltransferase